MHGSGIEVGDELKGYWATLDSSVAAVKIEISEDTFVQKDEVKSTGDWSKDWDAVRESLQPKEPCYFALRAEDDKTKFVFIPFVPDNSHVRKKMLYASSQGALKRGLGGNMFTKDYYITTAGECTKDGFTSSTKAGDKSEMLTLDEREAYEAHTESHMAMADVKVAAIVGVPIDISEAGIAAVKGVHDGTHNTTVLGVKEGTEILDEKKSGTMSLDDVAALLPENEPRYILHRFEGKDLSGETKQTNCFIYYCPGKAKPRSRMFYSTCKANVLQMLDKLGLEKPKSIEVDETNEVSATYMQAELYPVVVKKKVFAKPGTRGKGRAKFRGKKFTGA